MKRFVFALVPVASLLAAVAPRGASAPACDADNGGITLPQGFCAAVVATDVGPARHLAVAPNGDVFASTETGPGGAGGGIVALRDTDNDSTVDSLTVNP